ncbi:MAG: 16S rRNA (uracil(1498)-N(3))-methyltransferase [Halioglobus sp.]
MRKPRIYSPQPLTSGATLVLEEGPSNHIARALRMKANDSLVLFDGQGNQWPAQIDHVDKKAVTVCLGERNEHSSESPLHIHIGIAISRGDRMDWIIQKATELGVSAVTPLRSERSEVKLKGDREEKKLRHWRQISISACEQCGRNTLPQLNPLTSLTEWVSAVDAQKKYVLHHRASAAAEAGETPSSVALLIGPEGGLNDVEINNSEHAGFTALALGPRVLRTETAPLAAVAILQARWGDM